MSKQPLYPHVPKSKPSPREETQNPGPVHYILAVDKKQMEYTGDMLRYDNCFEVEEIDATYEVHTTNFTPERWRSFGYVPKVLSTLKVTAREYDRLCDRAMGFTDGVRFAQKLLGGSIMQSK